MTSSKGRWAWRKSSYSEANGNSDCVEIGFADAVRAVRDSKNPAGGMLTIPSASWDRFRAGL